MKKQEIIKKNIEFSKIINKGKNIRDKNMSIFYLKSKDVHFGISVPKKYGNAVERNKIKRQLKNIIDKNRFIIKNEYDYVIIVKDSLKKMKYLEIEKSLLENFKKVKGEQE